jgi:subtilisin family serine protease
MGFMDLSRARGSRSSLVVLAVGLTLAGAASAHSSSPREVESAAPSSAPQLWVVGCGDHASGFSRFSIEEAGATVLAHLGSCRWLVSGSGATIVEVLGEGNARQWRSADAVSPDLRSLASSTKTSRSEDVLVAVALAPGTPLTTPITRSEAVGARVSWVDRSTAETPQIGFRVPRDRLAALIEEFERTENLVWAEPQAPVRLLNDASVWRCQSGEPESTPVFDHGLRGEGQVIGIMDTGLDVDDCRFDDQVVGLPAVNGADGIEINVEHRKILAVDFHWDEDWPPQPPSWDSHGHGTHVAGSAAGDVLANQTHDGVDGMAPAAKLVIQDGGASIDDCADLPGLGCPVKPLEPVLEQAWAQGARIHTNSWGDEENFLPFGRYTERTADVDRFMWNHKDTLVFFAAGNSGPDQDTVISPSTAKNVVSVGATLHGDFEPACTVVFSSRGWTHDGRIKPDVLAPGMWVMSAATNRIVPGPSCSNAQNSGTSMAAPTAAGLGALVRQYFVDGFHPAGFARPADGFEPTAALIKAVLIASAVDLSTRGCPDEPIPSRDQGWGLIQLDTALAFEGDGHSLVVDDHREGFASPADEPVRAQVAVTTTGPLKVVLVWTDPPSSSLASTNLVNDLDLQVTGPDGVFLGNSFSGGVSVPDGEPDRLNNVEVVFLPEVGRGVWVIEVAPHAVSVPGQDFALVVTGPVRLEEGPRQPSGRVAP